MQSLLRDDADDEDDDDDENGVCNDDGDAMMTGVQWQLILRSSALPCCFCFKNSMRPLLLLQWLWLRTFIQAGRCGDWPKM